MILRISQSILYIVNEFRDGEWAQLEAYFRNPILYFLLGDLKEVSFDGPDKDMWHDALR